MSKRMRINNEEIIARYSSTVYRLAFAMLQNKSDADDVFQEVFLRYVKRQPTFNDTEHEKAWFIKVATNCAKSLLSSPFRKRTQQFVDYHEIYYMDVHSNELYELVTGLASKYRTVIHLFYYEDMSIAKISQVLSIKQATIRSQLSRARDMLKISIQGEDYEF